MTRPPSGGSEPATTRVTIFGRDYELAGDASSDYTRKIAGYVDLKMREIASTQNQSDPTRLAILAAMEISNELLEHRERLNRDMARAAEAADRLGQAVDGAP